MISWESHHALKLPKGEVHLWAGQLEQDPTSQKKLEACLSYDELRRADRFHFERDRNYFIVARAMLRQVLGRYLSLPAAELAFAYAAKGKPYLASYPKLYFNLSHAGSMALLGLSHLAPIGVDIEDTRREIEFEVIASHFFSKAEIHELRSLPLSQRAEGFYNCWTRKESFIKALGDGLSFPLDQFEVSLVPHQKPMLRVTHWDPQEKNYWSLGSLNPKLGYTAAWALRQKVDKVHFAYWKA